MRSGRRPAQMAATSTTVTVAGARSVSRRVGVPATSYGGIETKRCISVVSGRRLLSDVCKRRKTTTNATRRPAELLDELVTEILLRLPVKSLLRFKSVSKAWRAIISEPFFIRSHLRQSGRNPSLLITPHALDYPMKDSETWPTTFSTEFWFYKWQQQPTATGSEPEEEARFVMHCDDFVEEFNSVCFFAHCDGLVLAPTNVNVYLFNPATRAVMRLPHTDSNRMYRFLCSLPVGLGRDPRTGNHKVVRAFYRSRDPITGVHDMGMEVFTVGGDSWRQTTADPPYPVAGWMTPVFANGAMFWLIEKRGLDHNPHAILRLTLDDESFSVTRLPDSLDPALDESFSLDEVRGELCLTAFSSSEPSAQQPLKMWTLVEEEDGRRWEHRYSLNTSSMVHPLALLPGGGAMMVRVGRNLCRYDLQTNELTTLCDLDRLRYQRSDGTSEKAAGPGREIFCFNIVPFTESLVQITAQGLAPANDSPRPKKSRKRKGKVRITNAAA